jgi:catalase
VRHTLTQDGYAMHFVTEAYKHLKVVGAFGVGIKLLPKAEVRRADRESHYPS